MRDNVAARRYAQGFLESCRSNIGIRQAFEELEGLRRIIGESPGLEEFFENPEIDFLDKENFIERVFKKGFSSNSLNFLEFVIKKGRISQIKQIADYAKVIYQRETGIEKVSLKTSFLLDEKRLGQVKEKLEGKLQKKLELDTGIAPDLIGGIQAIVGNVVIDASVKRKLSDLRENLLNIKMG